MGFQLPNPPSSGGGGGAGFPGTLATRFQSSYQAVPQVGSGTIYNLNAGSASITGGWAQPAFSPANAVGREPRLEVTSAVGAQQINFGGMQCYYSLNNTFSIRVLWGIGAVSAINHGFSFGLFQVGGSVPEFSRTQNTTPRFTMGADPGDAAFSLVRCNGAAVADTLMTGFTRTANRLIDATFTSAGDGTLQLTANYCDLDKTVIETFDQTISGGLPALDQPLILILGNLFLAGNTSLFFQNAVFESAPA